MVKAIQYILGVILLLLVIIMTVYYHHFSTLTEEEKSMKHSILQYNNKISPHISNSNITTTNDLITLQAYINQQDNEIIALKTQLQQLQQQQQTENNININKNLHMPAESSSSSSSSYIVPRRYSMEAPPSTLQQDCETRYGMSLIDEWRKTEQVWCTSSPTSSSPTTTSHISTPPTKTLHRPNREVVQEVLQEEEEVEKEEGKEGMKSELKCYPYHQQHKRLDGRGPDVFCIATNFIIDFSKVLLISLILIYYTPYYIYYYILSICMYNMYVYHMLHIQYIL